MQQEIWKDIPDFKGYQVSNKGNVRSLPRIVKRGNHLMSIKGYILKQNPSMGYLSVNLRKNNKTYPTKVHRLVAMAFIANYNNYNEIDHINAKRTDNNVENLHWVSHRMNCRNPITNSKMRLAKRTEKVHGQTRIGCYKENRLEKIYNNLDQIKEELGLDIYKIRRCLLNKKNGKYTVKKVGGFNWKYL